jgi:hypothetical protein
MKYMLLIYAGENAINESEREKCYKESTQLCHDLSAKDQFISANPLQPVSTNRFRPRRAFVCVKASGW